MDLRKPTPDGYATSAAATVAEIRSLMSVADAPTTGDAPCFSDLRAVEQLDDSDHRQVRKSLLGLVLQGTHAAWSAADDHLGALENDLRRRPHAIWSVVTLARAIQESVILVCYLAEPAISLEQRLVRIAATWLEDDTYMVNAAPANHPNGIDYAQIARETRDEHVRELVRGGLTVSPLSGKPMTVNLGTITLPTKINTTERARLMMPPDAPEAYRLASGAAHSRPWFLTKNATLGSGAWTTQLATTAAAVSIAAFAAVEGLRNLAGYHGHSTENVAKIDAAHARLVAESARYGGLGDAG